jgi:hypothetical protein
VLGCFFIGSLLSSLNALRKQRGNLASPKSSLLELVKIYLNPRTLWVAVGDSSKKVCGTVKRWVSVEIPWRLLDILPVLDGRGCERNEKIFGGSWLNLLLAKWRKQKRIGVIGPSEVNPNRLDEKWHILRVTSDRNINGRRVVSYAYSDSEWQASLYRVEAHPVKIAEHSKNNGAHKQPNDPKLSHADGRVAPLAR